MIRFQFKLSSIRKVIFFYLFSISILGLSFSIQPASAAHPELQKIFSDLPLQGDESHPLLVSAIFEDPSLLTPETAARLKLTLQTQLIKVGFHYLKNHAPGEYNLTLHFTQSAPFIISAIDFVNPHPEFPIAVRNNSDGTLFLTTCFVGQRTLDTFKSIYAHLKQYRLAPYMRKEPLMQADDHGLIASLDLQKFKILRVTRDEKGSEIMELAYSVIPGFEIEMRLQANGILTVFASHQWIPGTKSKLSHCWSVAHFIHLAFSQDEV